MSAIYLKLGLGNIMIEYDYPECTTSVVTALAHFRKYFPTYRKNDIQLVNHLFREAEFEAASGRQWTAPSSIFTQPKAQRVFGWVAGASVSPMLPCSLWRVYH